MPKVLIVGKTRKWDKACVGGLQLDNGRSLRLLTSGGDDQPENTAYELGSIWEITLREIYPSRKSAPHVEDVQVTQEQFIVQRDRSEVRDYLLKLFGTPISEPKALFDGFVRYTSNRRWYVSPRDGLPQYSTGFWRFRHGLRLYYDTRNSKNPRARYIYLDDRKSSPTFDVPYVGYAKPIEVIAANSLLRFSLAQPFEDDRERRCYLQLSGWFL